MTDDHDDTPRIDGNCCKCDMSSLKIRKRAEGAEAEQDRVLDALRTMIEAVGDDRNEPDKLLRNIQRARRALLESEGDDMSKHNHLTRDIKALGKCPACDKTRHAMTFYHELYCDSRSGGGKCDCATSGHAKYCECGPCNDDENDKAIPPDDTTSTPECDECGEPMDGIIHACRPTNTPYDAAIQGMAQCHAKGVAAERARIEGIIVTAQARYTTHEHQLTWGAMRDLLAAIRKGDA